MNWRGRWFIQEDAGSKTEEHRRGVKPGYGVSSREVRMCRKEKYMSKPARISEAV